VEQVVREIGVVVREGAAYVVALAAARGDEFLEFRDDDVVAAAAVNVLAEAVVDFFSPVEAQNDVVALAVDPVDDLVCDADAVRRQREAEILVVLLFNAARVGDKLLADFKIEQRFAAEEIDLQIRRVPELAIR
jgi:hypothetical protein